MSIREEFGIDHPTSGGGGSADMSIPVNGHSFVPPGFRFHPTEEELLNYYLKKKVSSQRIDLDVIRDVDLNKLEPWDIQEECRIGSTPQNEWYFFSHKDKKYPTGTRTNRATAAGFWKATGRDKPIHSGSAARIGMRKTLVFYMGRAPHGQKSDWIMHEYRLVDDRPGASSAGAPICSAAEATDQDIDGWVVCRVFKKKNIHLKADVAPKKYSPSPSSSCSSVISEPALDQLLQHASHVIGTELPDLGSSTVPTLQDHLLLDDSPSAITGDWAAFDRLLASQLNGPCFDLHLSGNDQNGNGGLDDCGDLWSVTKTTKKWAMSDGISHE